MPLIWLIGDRENQQIATIISTLPTDARPEERFPTPGDALRSKTEPPDVVLVLQVRPAEFSRRDCEHLLGVVPLARFVVGLAAWCASHHRSERLWPEAVTVPIYEVSERLARELAAAAVGHPPLPLTAGRDEAMLAGYAPPRPFTA